MPLLSTRANASARGYGMFGVAAGGGTAYESIASYTIGSGGSLDVTFSSIPTTYKHLQIRYMLRNSGANVTDGYSTVQFNGDTTNGNYYFGHLLYGTGSGTPTSTALGTNAIIFTGGGAGNNASANIFGAGVIDILDYRNGNKYPTVRSLGGVDANGSGAIYLSSGSWYNTSAITSIRFGTAAFGANMMQYSHIALYGIKG